MPGLILCIDEKAERTKEKRITFGATTTSISLFESLEGCSLTTGIVSLGDTISNVPVILLSVIKKL